MPELTTNYARWCASNDYWEATVAGSKGSYTVAYTKTPTGPYAMGYTCTCPAFVHRHKECKHIALVKNDRCGHGWEAAIGSPTEMGDTCPECGGPTSAVAYGA